MATSSRQSSIFGVQDWKKIYQTFSQADFQSYDYETLRNSFVNYLRAYYPETFNDYTESSEFIALLDVIAFMGQSLAFRDDLNTRENFIDTASRRDSVIKLANLVSYNPKRNLAGQGWIKVTSVSTTENVFDISNNNLANQVVLWNDPANSSWQQQFNAILNAAFINNQQVGQPGQSSTILNVVTSEYSLNLPLSSIPVYPFTATVNNTPMNFELVSVTGVNSTGIYEIPPKPTSFFNMAYRNDKLGYGSANTGWFFYFKQGTLVTQDFNFSQKIQNQVEPINIQGINNTDTWLYQLNSNGTVGKQWEYTDNIYGTNTIVAPGALRSLFSVVSGTNDTVSYIFGDGTFAEIPVGNYRAYVRAGNALTYTIQPQNFQGVSVSLDYVSRNNRIETLTFTLELTQTVNTALARESLASIKERAPTRYYTQNRMVNGEDYTTFPYTLYSSIIKSTAINRTSVGVSRNLDLLDPSGKYSSTNNFGSDGALYQDINPSSVSFLATNSNDATTFVVNGLADILSQYDVRQFYDSYYPRYAGNYPQTAGSADGLVYWRAVKTSGGSYTGYFYIISQIPDTNPPRFEQQPIPVGIYSGYNMNYLTTGALVKIIPPGPQFYFNAENQLIFGTPTKSTDKEYFWATITDVVNDGYNNGKGKLSNGLGPISMNVYIPDGAVIDPFSTANPDPVKFNDFTNPYRLKYGIIPAFQNQLTQTVYREVVQRILLNKSFLLAFDNSKSINQDRWYVIDYTVAPANPLPVEFFINFISQGAGKYTVVYQTINYYFGSVDQNRFYFDSAKRVYDPVSGILLQDYVDVLATNTQPTSNLPLQFDIKTNIIGQKLESDGFADDYSVEISGLDANFDGVIDNPDFFSYITNYDYTAGASNGGIYVFFETVTDNLSLTRSNLLPENTVVYEYLSKNDILAVIYQYRIGTIFYVRPIVTSVSNQAGAFYQSELVPGTTTNQLQLKTVTNNYSVLPGRSGLQYQYRHNSPDTTRVDPGTTNIIDVYVVTQAYYTAYTNWLNDTTNVLPQPPEPTLDELQQSYFELDNYKMISDSLILNSVTFKPLFGAKASPALQGTIKVIRNSTTTASDSEIRTSVVNAMNSYFSIDNWNFGDTFYFSELSSYLHQQIGDYISSAVIVPADPTSPFGDLYEIRSAPYEIFVNAALASDVQVIAALTPAELQINGQ